MKAEQTLQQPPLYRLLNWKESPAPPLAPEVEEQQKQRAKHNPKTEEKKRGQNPFRNFLQHCQHRGGPLRAKCIAVAFQFRFGGTVAPETRARGGWLASYENKQHALQVFCKL
jgi:hypothetical protein